MVKVGLKLKANLECVTDLQPDGEDFRWYLKLKCTSCGEIPEHWQYVTQSESQPVKGGRGEANLVAKCKLCSRENSIDIVEDSLAAYNADNANQFKTIVAFDCRGMEPVDFDPRGGWKAAGCKEDEDGDIRNTGTAFADVDLSEKEWADFDEKSGESTLISELEWKFEKVH